MRVVVDGYVYGKRSSEGIARYWEETLKATLQLNLPVRFDVVVPPDASRPEGVPCRTHGSLSACWAAFRADVFHSTYYTRWPGMKCPSVVTVYDFVDATFPEFNPNGPGFVERQLEVLRRASAVIAISKATRNLAVEIAKIDPTRIFVAYPAVAEPFSKPFPEIAEVLKFRARMTGGAPYLLHVGKRRTYKNFRTILEAFCRSAHLTNRHLLILGRGKPLAEDEWKMATSQGVHNRIHFQPEVDDATMRLAYAGADAMVHASLMEGFGIPVIEALACGTGVILADIPVYREIAAGMATFVAPADVEAWAHAMAQPVSVDATWRKEILCMYTWDNTARRHLDAYACVAEN